MLSPGTLFGGRYEVLRPLSTGGMGTVYEVVHRETRRRRALKVMRADMLRDADLRRRFALEAQVTADVESEHIVETFDAGVDAATGCPFLVMELLRGEDLGSRLGRLSRLGAREVVGVLQQAARALERTHAAGIVHRDLKPENLFLTQRDDGSLRLKVLDFGIAKVVRESEVRQATRSMGTPLYMAPEQFEGEPRIGPAVDRYALAQIAYTLLVGEPYWAEEARALGSALALMNRVAKGAEEAPSARAARRGAMLPPEIDPWFLRATAVAPEERFTDVREQVLELADALGVPDAVDAPLFGTVPRQVTPIGDSTGAAAPPGASDPAADLAAATTQAEPSADRSEPGQPSDHDVGSRTVTEPPQRPRTSALLVVAVGVAVVAVGSFAVALRDPVPGTHSAPAAPSSSDDTVEPAPGPDEATVTAEPTSGSPAAPLASASAAPSASSARAAPSASSAPAAAPPAASRPRGRVPRRPAASASAPPPPSAPPASSPTAAPEPWRTR